MDTNVFTNNGTSRHKIPTFRKKGNKIKRDFKQISYFEFFYDYAKIA